MKIYQVVIGGTAIFLASCATKSPKSITSYQGFEITKLERCEPIPDELLEVSPFGDRVPKSPARKNEDLRERVKIYGAMAADERALRLQLIGALKMREASSGRKALFYEEQAAEIRAKIEELNKIETKPRGWFKRLTGRS